MTRTLDKDLFGRTPTKTRDWSHRRGEPRGLILLWTVFIMAAAVSILAPVAIDSAPGPISYRPAARLLMVVTSVGLVVLYPLVRLSQVGEARPVRSGLRDLVVLMAPLAFLVASSSLLSRWPVVVSLAAWCALLAWGLIAVGLAAIGNALFGAKQALAGRAVLMLLCLASTLGGLLLAEVAVRGPAEPAVIARTPTPGWMTSAPGSVYEVTRDRFWTGRAAAVSLEHWAAIGVTGCLGGATLAAAGVCSALSRTRDAS